jgi:hypothetical protein
MTDVPGWCAAGSMCRVGVWLVRCAGLVYGRFVAVWRGPLGKPVRRSARRRLSVGMSHPRLCLHPGSCLRPRSWPALVGGCGLDGLALSKISKSDTQPCIFGAKVHGSVAFSVILNRHGTDSAPAAHGKSTSRHHSWPSDPSRDLSDPESRSDDLAHTAVYTREKALPPLTRSWSASGGPGRPARPGSATGTLNLADTTHLTRTLGPGQRQVHGLPPRGHVKRLPVCRFAPARRETGTSGHDP